jgi:hypothetical protein
MRMVYFQKKDHYMNNKFELLSCPFCGSDAKIIENSFGLYYVLCSKIKEKHIVEMGPYRKRDAAIKAWNKRI